MSYSKEQKQALRQAGQIYRYIRNIQKNIDKPSGQIAWAEIHFDGNVPKVESRPSFSDFDLSDNVEELMEQEKTRTKEKIEHSNKIKECIVIILILLISLGFLCELVREEGWEVVWVAIFFIYPAFVLYEVLYGIVNKGTDDIFTQYDEKYTKYVEALLAYNYWQNIKSAAFWDSLDGHAFERKVADLYRKYGYDAVVSKAGGDGGIDIVLTKGEEKIAVQCKAHNKAVAPAVARDLFGTMISGGYKKGMIVSKNGFTKGVYDFVKDKDIELVDMDSLIQMVNNL